MKKRLTYIELTHTPPGSRWLIICRQCGELGANVRMWVAVHEANKHEATCPAVTR